jgi:hypothetical protein
MQITTQEGKLVGYYHPKGMKFWNDWVLFSLGECRSILRFYISI